MATLQNNKFVSKQLQENETFMKEYLGIGVSFDVDYREITILGRKAQIYYVNGLVNDAIIVEIMKMLIHVNDDESEEDKMYEIIKNRLIHEQVDSEPKMSEMVDKLLAGLIVIFVDGEREGFIVDVRQYPGREPEEPDTERVIRGSRDGFTENVMESTALIRRRIKDKHLRNEMFQVGTRSKTDVCISYLNDVANDDYVQIVKEK